MPRVEIDVLGALHLRVDGRDVPLIGDVRRRLLALLVLRRGRECRADWLADALWGGVHRDAAAATLQSHVAQLRRLVEPWRRAGEPWTVVRTVPGGYLLAAEAVQVDLDRFTTLVHGARTLSGTADALANALAVVRGPAFEEFAVDDPFRGDAARFDAMALATREERLDRLAAEGRHAEVVAEADELVAVHPLDERNWVRLADALGRTGRQAEGLRALARLRAELVDRAGLDPSAAVREAEQRLLTMSAPVPATSAGLLPPQTFYASRGGVHIAYQSVGAGPVLVAVPPMAQNIEICWQDVHHRRMIERIAQHCRFVHFDKRGTGMSDRVVGMSLEERVDDFLAVLDAAEVDRAVMCGVSEAGPLAIAFAAAHPERVSGLLLVNTFARATWAADYPIGAPGEQVMAANDEWCREWGREQSSVVQWFAPSMADDAAYCAWLAHYMRQSCSPGTLADICRANREIDVRALLPLIGVPTTVAHRVGDRVSPVEWGRFLATTIAGAEWVELPGADHLPWIGEGWERIADLAVAVTLASAG